ncbi:hypothetical protein [Pedosphaera parvula]|uniref:Ferritin-like domain-containing protein n=1 Tax=Pedosphaera parvula (strain Ellin514) TaxID=320771 RepID=B9XBE1_PEDPL|nr:hypothetical protein [Pedosphaera parvula]EEF62826.1 conserved hypothetical protein [Pedosphaera parvula Ellin514]
MQKETPKFMARRSFMKGLGLGGVALIPASSLLADQGNDHGKHDSKLSRGDAAILRLLAAAEILETDLWQQYTELALGNPAYQLALEVLDGDMPTYVNQNTRDEFSHQSFINAYLMSKGQKPINLDQFRTLPSSQATGSNKTAKRLTNLMDLTVDTSWYLRYRSPGNPDFGDTFAQIVTLQNVPAIPNHDLPLPTDPTFGFEIQLIANTAGFHFATIEQGGSSLYQSFLPKATSLEVLKIVGAIGGTEIQHFQTWQDKAGNAPQLFDNHGNEVFPQLPHGPDPVPDGIDHAEPIDTNQIMPAPCKFISTSLPLCSVIRPISTQQAGAVAAFTGFTQSGLFSGQSKKFFDFVFDLAEEADEARRECD